MILSPLHQSSAEANSKDNLISAKNSKNTIYYFSLRAQDTESGLKVIIMVFWKSQLLSIYHVRIFSLKQLESVRYSNYIIIINKAAPSALPNWNFQHHALHSSADFRWLVVDQRRRKKQGNNLLSIKQKFQLAIKCWPETIPETGNPKICGPNSANLGSRL